MGTEEEKGTVEARDEDVAYSSTSSGSPGENDEKPRLNWQTWMAILALMFQLNSYLFTLSMPPAVLAFINEDLGPDSSYTWITVSWNLGAAVIVTVSGRIADIFALGCIGSLVGATAKNIPTMIVSGVIFGIGGGFQEMCFSCIQEMVPNRYRFIILGVNELSNTPSQFSALISYAFMAYVPLGWRTCYYWCFAFELVSVILLFLFYHPPSFETKHQGDRKAKMQLLPELDYIGLVIFTGACTILLMAINWGGSMHPWKSAAVIAPICISGVLFVLLGFWEVYAPLKYPILPPRLFRKWRDFTSILVVVFVCGILYYSNLALWPRISSLLFVPSDDIIMRGLYANMTAFSVILASLYCVLIMPWIGHERWQLVALSVLQTAFIGGFSSMSIDDQAKQIAFLMIAGMAATASSPLVFGMISLGLEDQTDIGLAVGLVSTSRLVGGAVGGAVYTSIYTNRYASNIPGQIKKAAASSGFTGPVDQLLKASATNTPKAYSAVPGINDAVISACQLAVKLAYVDAFSLVYEVAIAFGAFAIIASLCTRTVDKTKKSNNRAVRLENEKKPSADLECSGGSS